MCLLFIYRVYCKFSKKFIIIYIYIYTCTFYCGNNNTFDVLGITGVLRNLVAEFGVKQLSTNIKPMSFNNKHCWKLACNISHMDAILTCQWLKHATMTSRWFWIKKSLLLELTALNRRRALYKCSSQHTRVVSNTRTGTLRIAAARRHIERNARMSSAVSLLAIATAKLVQAVHMLICINIYRNTRSINRPRSWSSTSRNSNITLAGENLLQ